MAAVILGPIDPGGNGPLPAFPGFFHIHARNRAGILPAEIFPDPVNAGKDDEKVGPGFPGDQGRCVILVDDRFDTLDQAAKS